MPTGRRRDGLVWRPQRGGRHLNTVRRRGFDTRQASASPHTASRVVRVPLSELAGTVTSTTYPHASTHQDPLCAFAVPSSPFSQAKPVCSLVVVAGALRFGRDDAAPHVG